MKKIKEMLGNKKIIVVLLAIYTVIAMSISLDIISEETVSKVTTSNNSITRTLVKFSRSLKVENSVNSLVMFVAFVMFYKKVFFVDKNEGDNKLRYII